MRCLVDENIPRMTVLALRELGHEVKDLRGTPEEGVPDEVLWDIVQRERLVLITTDKGFARHREASHPGMLVVRLRQPNRWKIHSRVMEALAHIDPEEWPGLLVVVRDSVQSAWRRA